MKSKRQPPWTWSPEEIPDKGSSIAAGKNLNPDSWPNGKSVAVAFTFDVDAETVWFDFNETSPSALSRGTFGVRRGMERILNMLSTYELPATFFVPAATLILHPELATRLSESPHEVGYHGYFHESPRRLNAEEERTVFLKGLEQFEKSLDRRPKGYRSPAFELSEETPGLLESEGFLYDSSLMADDRPYELISPSLSRPLIELPVEWLLDDWAYFQAHWRASHVALRNPAEVFEIFRQEFLCARDEGTLFILTLHPQVIGHRHRFKHLENFVKTLKDDPNVWITTCQEISEWIEKQRT